MFNWAIVDCENRVLSMHKATLDVPVNRKFECWEIIPFDRKWRTGLAYNPLLGDVE